MQVARRSTFNLAINRLCSRSVAINSVITEEESTHLKSWKEIPGPSSLPIIGPMLHFLPGGILYDTTESMWKVLLTKYGRIVRLEPMFGSEPIVMIFDAQAAALVLRNENWMPVRHGMATLDYYRQKNQKEENSPLGLLTDHNEAWKKLRSTANPIMLQPKTIKLYSGALEEVAEDMVARMRQKRNEKCMIEAPLDFEIKLWALESVCVVALGCRLNCLTRELAEDSPEKTLIKTVNDIFSLSQELDVNPSIWRFISTPKFKKLMKCYETQDLLTKHFIKKGKQEIDKYKNKGEKGVLEKFLDINEDVAVASANDMLLAGTDSLSNSIISTLYLLAVNQEKQNKLREEIMSKGERNPYLRACLKESFRRMSVVPGNSRQTTKEYNIMGYKIPKNMTVAFGHQYISLFEEHFSRPEEYIPERWIVDKTDPLYYGNADPFAYSPFGFGARSCIGRRIAELEAEMFISKLIKNFRVEWIGPPIKVQSTILNNTMPPFNFTFKDI